MSDRDIYTDNNRPFSPISQDDSSIDSSNSTISTPRRNPYLHPPNHIRPTLTTQQLYTKTNRTTQPSIKQWLHSNQQTTPKPAPSKPKTLPITKLQSKRQPTCTIQPSLHQLLTNNHWGNIPTTNPVNF